MSAVVGDKDRAEIFFFIFVFWWLFCVLRVKRLCLLVLCFIVFRGCAVGLFCVSSCFEEVLFACFVFQCVLRLCCSLVLCLIVF